MQLPHKVGESIGMLKGAPQQLHHGGETNCMAFQQSAHSVLFELTGALQFRHRGGRAISRSFSNRLPHLRKISDKEKPVNI